MEPPAHAQLTWCRVVLSAFCDGDGDAAPGDRGGGVPRAPLPPPLQHPRHPGIQIPLWEITAMQGLISVDHIYSYCFLAHSPGNFCLPQGKLISLEESQLNLACPHSLVTIE